jgi:hypothetical protein
MRGQFLTFDGVVALTIVALVSVVLLTPVFLKPAPTKTELSFYTMTLMDALENSRVLEDYVLHGGTKLQRIINNTYQGYCIRLSFYDSNLRLIKRVTKAGCSGNPDYVIWRDTVDGTLVKVEAWHVRE